MWVGCGGLWVKNGLEEKADVAVDCCGLDTDSLMVISFGFSLNKRLKCMYWNLENMVV